MHFYNVVILFITTIGVVAQIIQLVNVVHNQKSGSGKRTTRRKKFITLKGRYFYLRITEEREYNSRAD